MFLDPTAVCAQDAIIKGDVSVGPATVVHPYAVLDGSRGKITIGRGCMVRERASIVAVDEAGVTIGDYCVLDPLCIVKSQTVGMLVEVGVGATLMADIPSYCRIGAKETVTKDNCVLLEEGSVMYGSGQIRRDIMAKDPVRKKEQQAKVKDLGKQMQMYNTVRI